jgi:metal-responsive CopG/Arc/MetJ family transcriptional regulator
MKRRKVAANSVNSQNEASSVRATISFPSDIYATLDEIAKQKKVSLAWVVREATEKYLADKWPLLKGQG